MDSYGQIPSVIPDVIDRLLDLCAARFTVDGADHDPDGPTCVVLDAIDDSLGRGEVLVIGAGDPNVEGFTEAADSTSNWSTAGVESERAEIGDITCCVTGWGGSDKMRDPRGRVYALLADLVSMLHRNPTLKADVSVPTSPGVDGLQWVEFGSSTRLIQGLDDRGNRVVIVMFRIHFEARI